MNIVRFYNQNRLTFWAIIVIIIFVIIMIQVLNGLAIKKADEEKNNPTAEEVIPYEKESKSIISEGSVSSSKREINGNLIDDFLKNCIDGNIEDAYNLLSQDCKDVYYNSIEDFQRLYYEERFNTPKKYRFQSWTSGSKDIYQVKISEDLLATGKAKSNKYIEEYYTIVKEDEDYKLNINNYIGKQVIGKSENKEGITIEVQKADIYKEYTTYTIKVKNETDSTIKIDSTEKSNTTYLEDDNKVKFIGLLYENFKNDLIIEGGKEKTITIKFNVLYREDLNLEKMVFSDIIKNYDKYLGNQEDYNDRENIEIQI